MAQDDETIEQPEGQGGHDEKVARCDLGGVILEECPPRGRGGLAAFGHVTSDGGLGDMEAEFEQFAMNARRSPKRKMWSSTFSALCEASGYVESAGSDRLDAMR